VETFERHSEILEALRAVRLRSARWRDRRFSSPPVTWAKSRRLVTRPAPRSSAPTADRRDKPRRPERRRPRARGGRRPMMFRFGPSPYAGPLSSYIHTCVDPSLMLLATHAEVLSLSSRPIQRAAWRLSACLECYACGATRPALTCQCLILIVNQNIATARRFRAGNASAVRRTAVCSGRGRRASSDVRHRGEGSADPRRIYSTVLLTNIILSILPDILHILSYTPVLL